MLAILAVTFPFFALVLCGYLAARRGVLPQAAIPGLNTFVLYFALPCMLYRFGANTPLAQLLDPGVFTVYLFSALAMVALTMATTLSRRIDWNNAAFGALVAAFPNTGFMGVPLLVALLGARASGPVILTIMIDMVITSSLCIALSHMGGARTSSGVAAARSALKGMASNPMPLAILLGALASWVDLALPKPVMQTIGLLADAASPVALFTIGAVLARSQMASCERLPLVEYVPVALKKLVLHPLLILLVGRTAMYLGMPLDPHALTVIVLVGCLPSASNVAMLAERFGANTERIARIILISTVLSFLTFSGAVVLLT